MDGMKCETDVIQGKDILDPRSAKINFACPNEQTVAAYEPLGDFPSSFKPGILTDMIKLMAKHNDVKNSYMLMLDGKKMKHGTDVDLLGFENGPTLTDRLHKRDADLSTVRNAVETLQRP